MLLTRLLVCSALALTLVACGPGNGPRKLGKGEAPVVSIPQ